MELDIIKLNIKFKSGGLLYNTRILDISRNLRALCIREGNLLTKTKKWANKTIKEFTKKNRRLNKAICKLEKQLPCTDPFQYAANDSGSVSAAREFMQSNSDFYDAISEVSDKIHKGPGKDVLIWYFLFNSEIHISHRPGKYFAYVNLYKGYSKAMADLETLTKGINKRFKSPVNVQSRTTITHSV